MAEPFRVVFVCSGNQVRSPLAAALLERLTEGLPVEIASAGTLGIEGPPPPPEAQQVAAALGVDVSGHRSTALRPAVVAGADLVIGFERAHVAAAVVEAGAPLEASFTLAELVRLLGRVGPPVAEGDPAERARALVAAAAAARRQEQGFVPGEDVSDPIGGPLRGFELVGGRIAELIADLAALLFARPR